MARIGDFREAFLSPELVSAHGHEDNITNIRDAFNALKLCCWLNTLERRLFSAPYESKDCHKKFQYFLPRFAAVLCAIEDQWDVWQQEYKQVVSGFEALQGPDSSVERDERIGLAVIVTPEPLHYYSLFSHTVGCDVVLMVYDGQRYEVECKYTQFVSVYSRPVWPRVDMEPLAEVLNHMEQMRGVTWLANRFTDSGPLLRLERPERRLTKAQRYGHPCDRPIHSSSLPVTTVMALLQSFLDYGMQGNRPRRGGWSWEELHKAHARRSWVPWSSTCMEQFLRGELNVTPSSSGVMVPRWRGNSAGGAEVGTPRGVASVVAEGEALLRCERPPPLMSEASSLMSAEQAASLAGALPPLARVSTWTLLYSTARDGTSLNTFYRKCAAATSTVLLVKDNGGYVFGVFASEAWHIAPRFYGTGETFVFQLVPYATVFRAAPSAAKSSPYFMYGAAECLGVGGAGHWAVYIDGDLLGGSSGVCDTFNSPCLASRTEFQVLTLEVWRVI